MGNAGCSTSNNLNNWQQDACLTGREIGGQSLYHIQDSTRCSRIYTALGRRGSTEKSKAEIPEISGSSICRFRYQKHDARVDTRVDTPRCIEASSRLLKQRSKATGGKRRNVDILYTVRCTGAEPVGDGGYDRQISAAGKLCLTKMSNRSRKHRSKHPECSSR